MLFNETYEEYMALYTEDIETAKKVAKVAGKAAKGTAKLAGKSALAFADYMTGGDVSKGIDFVKSSYEDEEYELDDEAREMLMKAEDILGNLEDQGFDDLAANGIDGAGEEHADAEGYLYNLQDQGWTRGSAAWHLSRDIVRHGRKAIPETEER